MPDAKKEGLESQPIFVAQPNLAAEDAKVVVGGRKRERMEALATEIGGDALECDIASKAQVGAIVSIARDKFGRVDIGLNATDWGLLRPFEATTEADLDRMTGIRFKGPFLFCQALVGAASRRAEIPPGRNFVLGMPPKAIAHLTA